MRAAYPAKRLPTPGFAGYNLSWSPFFPDRLAIAAAANYGLVGNGRVFVGNTAPQVHKFFDTQDGIFDVAWSEVHENQFATACGDGSIKLWDASLNDYPIRNWQEHSREVFCVDWNNVEKELFASSSWDGSVKVWHPERPSSIQTLPPHDACVYKCAWSPHHPMMLATGSGDGTMRVYDLRLRSLGPPVAMVSAGGEVLSTDWNKYRPMTLATGSTDRVIKTWDLRSSMQPGQPREAPASAVLVGHMYAVRDVAWSPHQASVLASASYDMTARIWNVDDAQHVGPTPVLSTPRFVYTGHTEFVVGVGWSLFEPGLIGSASWDVSTHLWMAPS